MEVNVEPATILVEPLSHDKAACGSQGFQYVQFPKIGQVLVGGNILPFNDYLVNPMWLTHMLQLGKMTMEDAGQQITQIGVNAQRSLENPERVRAELEVDRMAEHVAKVHREL